MRPVSPPRLPGAQWRCAGRPHPDGLPGFPLVAAQVATGADARGKSLKGHFGAFKSRWFGTQPVTEFLIYMVIPFATARDHFVDDVRVMGNVLHRLRVPRRGSGPARGGRRDGRGIRATGGGGAVGGGLSGPREGEGMRRRFHSLHPSSQCFQSPSSRSLCPQVMFASWSSIHSVDGRRRCFRRFQDRNAAGSDVNPVAVCVSARPMGKREMPAPACVKRCRYAGIGVDTHRSPRPSEMNSAMLTPPTGSG